MSSLVTLYKVFLASPSDLADERARFHDVLMDFNERYALRQLVYFMPLYWEQNVAGYVDPQTKAKERLDECDFSIIVFGERWGSPPFKNKGRTFTSGTEEEFYRSVENHKNPKNPLKDIVVLFKNIPRLSLESPNSEIKRILRFKSKIRSMGFSYLSFEDSDSFCTTITKHLSEWLDNHQKGGGKIEKAGHQLYEAFKNRDIEHIPFPDESETPIDPDVLVKMERADELANAHKIREVLELYHAMMKEHPSLVVINAFAKFLYRIGDLAEAELLFTKVLTTARIQNSLGWMARATANLAIICLSRGEHKKAITLLQESLSYNITLEHVVGIADNHRHLSIVFRQRGDLTLALEHIEKAIEAFKDNDAFSGLADAYADKGVICRIQGDYNGAVKLYEKAININRTHAASKESCFADYLNRLGSVYRIKGELKKAKELYGECHEINTRLFRQRGISEVLGHLGLIEFYQGDHEHALSLIEEAIAIDRQLSHQENLAKHFLNKARVLNSMGRYELAIDFANQAMDINIQIDSSEGKAYSSYLLAESHFLNRDVDSAESYIDESIIACHMLNSGEGLNECREIKATIYLSKGLYRPALDWINDALSFCEKSGSMLLLSSLLVTRANIYKYMNHPGYSSDLDRALNIAQECGETWKTEWIRKQMKPNNTLQGPSALSRRRP